MLKDATFILCYFSQKLSGIYTVSKFKPALFSESGDHLIIINSDQETMVMSRHSIKCQDSLKIGHPGISV